MTPANNGRKPHGFWTYDRCRLEALKYSTSTEFQKHSGSASNAARLNGWLEVIGSHFIVKSSQNNYWTFERCKNRALQCNSLSEFHRTAASAAARRNGWFDEITSHMKRRRSVSKVLTMQECLEIASKHSTKTEFRRKDGPAYRAAKKNGWYELAIAHMKPTRRSNGDRADGYWTKARCLEVSKKFNSKSELRAAFPYVANKGFAEGWWVEMTAHMDVQRLSNGYWTKEACADVARQYELRSDFKKADGSAYLIANRKGWLDEICDHMRYVGNRNSRCVYQIIFSDKSIYIGLTYDAQERLANHKLRTKSLRKKFAQYSYQYQVSEYMDADAAAEEEKRLIAESRESGFEVLNKNRGGSLGGAEGIWTKAKCKQTALEFETKARLKEAEAGCYGKMRKEGWLEELCAHMRPGDRGGWGASREKKWTKDNCALAAQKYSTRTEFARNSTSAYSSAWSNGWLDEICAHMTELQKPHGYWEEKRIALVAKSCKTKKEFYTDHKSAYMAAQKLGLIDKVSAHMKEIKKPNGYWTVQRCNEESQNYTYLNDFRGNSAYNVSKKKGWLKDGSVGSHLIRRRAAH